MVVRHLRNKTVTAFIKGFNSDTSLHGNAKMILKE